ncbi:arginine transporter [Nioella aestuarii]|uniref:arginine transporter n=1 Tax=Nioella aestuarii TaxID=1662864 RepID=UPI003D7F4D28
MTKTFSAFLITFLLTGGPLNANPVERACMSSGRTAANPSLCACIGSAARITLNFGEQRRAARLFDDPDEAEELRMSDNSRDEAFWDRYRAFGDTAEQMCG